MLEIVTAQLLAVRERVALAAALEARPQKALGLAPTDYNAPFKLERLVTAPPKSVCLVQSFEEEDFRLPPTEKGVFKPRPRGAKTTVGRGKVGKYTVAPEPDVPMVFDGDEEERDRPPDNAMDWLFGPRRSQRFSHFQLSDSGATLSHGGEEHNVSDSFVFKEKFPYLFVMPEGDFFFFSSSCPKVATDFHVMLMLC